MSKELFTFEDMSVKDKAAKAVARLFAKAGTPVVSQDVDATTKRTSGVSYREMILTFADSQTVAFRIKQTGDIFQVLLNGKVIPIKNQDNQEKAVLEMINALDAGRSRFQKKLAAAAVKLPPSIKTAAPKIEAVLTEKRDALKAAIVEVLNKIKAAQAV